MKSRHKRLALIGGALAVFAAIVGLVLYALSGNINHFYSPTEVAEGKAPKEKVFRVGGLVKQGSLKREADGVTMSFIVTDTAEDLAINYKGILPDLFKEGKSAVVEGKFNGEGRFVANTVLAKHDENYMPPEAAKAMADARKHADEKRAAAGQSGGAPAATPASAPAKSAGY